MDRTSRYLFILLGFIIFLVLAPTLVLYITGTRVGIGVRDSEQTGILVVKSQPSGAMVFLNEQKKDNTPSTTRFLKRDDYLTRISKDGFFDWTKTLSVEAGKVTFSYEGVDAVYLIKKPQPAVVSGNVTCFVYVDDTLWFGQPNALGYSDASNYKSIASLSLPFTPRAVAAIPGSSFLLAEDEGGRKVLVSRDTKVVTQLPASLNTATNFAITPNGYLLALRDSTLYRYDLSTRVLSPIAQKIGGFVMLGSAGYFAKQDTNYTLQTAQWIDTGFGPTSTLLDTELPSKGPVQLIIAEGKQLFMLSAGTLYRVNSVPEIVSGDVKKAEINAITGELTFQTSSELWFYSFSKTAPQLLTRNTASVNDFRVQTGIGYGFIGTSNGAVALEIDNRDHQNRYPLLTGNPVWQIAVSGNQKTVFALQDGQLLSIPIRD